MDDGFEEVERPARAHCSRHAALKIALRRTLDTGKAIRVPLNGWPLTAARQFVADTARRLQPPCIGHTSQDGTHLIAWLTPRADVDTGRAK